MKIRFNLKIDIRHVIYFYITIETKYLKNYKNDENVIIDKSI